MAKKSKKWQDWHLWQLLGLPNLHDAAKEVPLAERDIDREPVELITASLLTPESF